MANGLDAVLATAELGEEERAGDRGRAGTVHRGG